MAATLAKMLFDARASEEMISCALRYQCGACHNMAGPRTRRPAAIPRMRTFNEIVLVDANFITLGGTQDMLYHIVDDATRFHVRDVIDQQTSQALFQSIMTSWIRWA